MKHRAEELVKLEMILRGNRYTKWQIKKHAREDPKPKFILPFIQGVTDRIARLLRNRRIAIIFETSRKIKNLLRPATLKIENENQGVYEIPCANCNSTDVGTTNRRVSARIKEHILSVKHEDEISALSQHTVTIGHEINFEGTKTLARVEKRRKSLIREALEIEKWPRYLNKRYPKHGKHY